MSSPANDERASVIVRLAVEATGDPVPGIDEALRQDLPAVMEFASLPMIDRPIYFRDDCDQLSDILDDPTDFSIGRHQVREDLL